MGGGATVKKPLREDDRVRLGLREDKVQRGHPFQLLSSPPVSSACICPCIISPQPCQRVIYHSKDTYPWDYKDTSDTKGGEMRKKHWLRSSKFWFTYFIWALFWIVLSYFQPVLWRESLSYGDIWPSCLDSPQLSHSNIKILTAGSVFALLTKVLLQVPLVLGTIIVWMIHLLFQLHDNVSTGLGRDRLGQRFHKVRRFTMKRPHKLKIVAWGFPPAF